MLKTIKIGKSKPFSVEFEDSALWAIDASIKKGERIGVACSGGADSVFLLRALLSIFGDNTDKFTVLHFNHKARRNAEIDEAFVRSLCENLRISSKFGFSKTSPKRISEAAFREMRVSFFERAASECKLGLIAQGHHLGDVAETLIMRIMRGSGSGGLSAPRAISHLNGVTYVRPLLRLSRDFIYKALRGAGMEWREDESNAECAFLRNKIRNVLMPVVREISPCDFLESAGRTRRLLEEDSDFIEKFLDSELDEAAKNSAFDRATLPGSRMALGGVVSGNASLLRRAVLRFLSANSMAGKFRAGTIDAFVESALKNAEASVSVGDSFLRFDSIGKSLFLDKRSAPLEFEIPLAYGKNKLPDLSLISVKKVRLSPAKKEALLNGDNDDSIRAYMDPDAIGGDFDNLRLTARTRRPGDSYAPIGASSDKKLKDLFSAKKTLLSQRKRAVLVCNAKGEILWSPGLAPARQYAVSKGFTVLELTFTPSCL